MSDGGETDERRTVRYRRPRDSCQSKSSTVPRISHWPRPRQRWIGSVALLLFESRWWGKAGVRSPWIGSRLRVVRAHFQNYRPWRHIERCAHRVGPRASLSSAAQSLPWPSPPLRFRKFRSVEELERRRLYRNTRNDVVGLCSVSRLGCPIKQGGGKWIWGGVQWITKKKKKDSSGRLWQCSDLLIVICFCSTSLRIRSYLRFFRVNYSLWRKTRRESQPRHQNWAGLAPTGRRPLYEVSLYCLLLDLVRALEDVWTLVERCLKLV